MRLTLAAIFFAMLPSASLAQTSFTLPPIGGPLPPIGLGPTPSPPVSWMRPSLPVHRPDRGFDDRRSRLGSHRQSRYKGSVVYFFPTYGTYGWGYPFEQEVTPPYDPPPPHQEPGLPTGLVKLELQPAGPHQIFVDGYYVGTIDDVRGELRLEAVPHRIEVRADGFELMVIELRVTAGQTITYRETLKPLAAEAGAEPPAAIAPTTIYFIPGCYLGNIAPDADMLPAHCDIKQLVTSKR